jgi:16S rRNA (guanine527-N7)-methyltransferase
VSYAERATSLAAALGCALSSEAAETLGRFAGLVETWNEKMNLTAAREPTALTEVLFADALVLTAETLIPTDAAVLDVGSGAGAPAIPLALLRDDVSMTLVEPLHKRVAFMRTAIGSLGLAARVKVVEGRLDPGDRTPDGGPFDVAMSRATLAPPDWLSLGLAHAPRVLVLTAAEAPPVSDAAERFTEVGYALPSSGAKRVVSAYRRL